MDKAYADFQPLNRIDDEDAFFVTRTKGNMKYDVISEHFNTDRTLGLAGGPHYRSRKPYKKLHLIEYSDPDSGELLLFTTNIIDCIELNELELANIYRHRWDIESLLKLIKQTLTIKHMFGYSENAVKTYLWSAICAYLLLAKVNAIYNITQLPRSAHSPRYSLWLKPT